DRRLDHVGEGAAGAGQHLAQVGEDLEGLGREVARDELAGRRIEADLAGGVEPAVDRDGLGVGSDGARGAVRVMELHLGIAPFRAGISSREGQDGEGTAGSSGSQTPTYGRLRKRSATSRP